MTTTQRGSIIASFVLNICSFLQDDESTKILCTRSFRNHDAIQVRVENFTKQFVSKYGFIGLATRDKLSLTIVCPTRFGDSSFHWKIPRLEVVGRFFHVDIFILG